MGFGVFNIFDVLKGGGKQGGSNDPNSPYFTGGSGNLYGPEASSRALTLYDTVNRSLPSWYNEANVMLPNVRPDESGFMPYQRTGINVFANLLRNQNSADWSSRGFNMPTSNDAVVGSALTQAAPFLFSLQNQNQFIPGELASQRNVLVGQRAQNALAPLQALQPVLQAGQYSRGPGLEYLNRQAANQNWWQMWNNIGSYWGGAGGAKAIGGGGGIG